MPFVTYISSPYTGLIYGSPDRYGDANLAFRRAFEGFGEWRWRLVHDNDVPEWARCLTPGEYVEDTDVPS